MKQDTETKNGIAIILFVLVLGVSLFLWNNYTTKNIEEHGVFLIAKITLREKSKNGSVYTFNYVFNKKKYITKFSSIPNEFLNKDSLAFLKIMPNNPLTFKYVETRVPNCLTSKDSPSDGWKQLPVCW